MLKKFRRSSKAKVEQTRRTSSIATSTPMSTRKYRVTFFDIPGEIRNDIYTLIASCSTLRLFHPSQTRPSKKLSASTIPSLLLASKQCRNEYLPLLLSIAPITATTTDFDFRDLQRVIGSLYSTELKSLRANPALRIELRLRKCRADVVPNLRRWCVGRANSLDRLGWEYVLEEGVPENRLAWFVGRVRVLLDRVEGECEKWEVRQVLDCLRGGVPGDGDGVTGGQRWAGYGDDFAFVMASRKFASRSA